MTKRSEKMLAEVPANVYKYNVSHDAYVDLRTGKQLTAEVIEDQKYVSFSEWFEKTVQAMVERGCPYHHAPAFLACDLLEGYLRQMVTN